MKQLKKVFAMILCVLMIFSLASLTAFADKKVRNFPVQNSENMKEDNVGIEKELVEQRDEFTKVYQLEDGSFCEITSSSPLHILQDGHWTEAKKIALPQKVEDIEKTCKKLVTATKSINSTEHLRSTVFDDNVTPVFLNASNDEYIDENSIMLLKINNIVSQRSFQLTQSARVFLDLSIEAEDSSFMYAYKNISSMDNVDYSDYNTFDYISNGNNENNLLDKVEITDSNLYSFEITKAYDSWSKGFCPNDGLAFCASSSDNYYAAYYAEMFVLRTYTIIQPSVCENNHVVDMDEAGLVHIDPYVNTLMVQREETPGVSTTLPVDIQHIYEQYKYGSTATDDYYGVASYLNYTATITEDTALSSVGTTVYRWTDLQGKPVCFSLQNGATTATDSGYTLTKSNTDFTDSTIVGNNVTYHLRSDGQIEEVYDSSNALIVKIVYVSNSNRIHYIEDSNNLRFYFNYLNTSFTYNNSSFQKKVLTKITVKQFNPVTHGTTTIQINGNDAVYQYTYTPVAFEQVALSKVTFPNATEANYTYSSGTLSSITKADGRRITFNYSEQIIDYSITESTNRYVISAGTPTAISLAPTVCGYTIETLNNQSYSTEYTVTINNKSVNHRVFEYNNGDEEIYIYDSSLRLVSKKTADNKYYSYTYDIADSVKTISNETIGGNYVTASGFHNLAYWDGNSSGGPSGISSELNYLGGGYNKALLLNANTLTNPAYSEQSVSIIDEDMEVVTIGAEFHYSSQIKKDGIIGIEVYAYDYNSSTGTLLDTILVDSSTCLEKQTCFKTIDLGEDLDDYIANDMELIVRPISYVPGINVFVDNVFCYN